MVVIIGAGITGLVLGYHLKQAGKDFRIYEASDRAGGNMQSLQTGDYLLEAGPNSLIMNDQLHDFLGELDLVSDIRYADPRAKNRYVLRDGQYRKLPSGPPSLLFSSSFSFQAKRKLLGERKRVAEDIPGESVDHFFRRRLGDEITDYAVYPFISGIYAGDPKQLLIAEAFPRLKTWEMEHGSVLKGFIKTRTPQTHKGTFSFKQGLNTFTQKLADLLEDHILYGETVSEIHHDDQKAYSITLASGEKTDQIPKLVSTIPAHLLSPVLTSIDPAFSEKLLDIPYPSVSVVATAYKRSDIRHPLDGFGALHNQKEKSETLGTIFTSSIFPERAPSDEHLLTTFIGGALHPEKGMADEASIRQMIRSDHQRFLGLSGEPVFQQIFRWPKAIPQYDQSIPAIRPLVEKWEKQGLYMGGNWWGGIAVSSCLERAHKLAEILCG